MLLGLALLASAGCATLGWYAQAARGQFGLLASRQDIEKVIAAPGTDEAIRRKLELVLAARQFAADRLGLPHEGSYGSYVALEREAVVWNVIAAPEFSVQPKTWCYPLVGCLAYRGWFRQAGAERAAARLKRDGLDVRVAPVRAYSTLGRFDDPVTRPMLELDDADLAGLIFHELAHQRVFAAGDTEFNEAYAGVVERAGVARWLEANDETGALTAWQRRRELEHEINRRMLAARTELGRIYALALPAPTRRAAKRAVFDLLTLRLAALAADHGLDPEATWVQRERNNADLALVASYRAGADAFADLLAEYDGDLDRFHHAVQELAEAGCRARAEFLNQSRNASCRD